MKDRRFGAVALGAVLMLTTNGFAQEGDGGSSQSILDALRGGTPKADARLRYEHAQEEGKQSADALTVRPRLGYLTAPYKGVNGFLEFEHVQAIPDDEDYNAAGLNGQGGRTVIADVEGTELNQAWLSGSCPLTGVDVKAGRQRIKLDNERFIGNVGWRQNEQTYDSLTATKTLMDQVALFYGYVWEVNRIFGQDKGSEPSGEAANAAQFDSEAHLINAALTTCPYATLTGYAYLLDLGQGTVARANSSDTVGVRLDGKHEVEEGKSVAYSVEYANQGDNDATTEGVTVDADYLAANLSGTLPVGTLGVGYEVLGSDDGVSFKTPLATLHAFNGWADVFLTTPDEGLEDSFVYVATVCPLTGVNGKLVYHEFASDEGDIDYGSEIDAVLSRKVLENVNMIAKFSSYNADAGEDNPRVSDVEKFSVEANVSF